jgi:hypothetical protein
MKDGAYARVLIHGIYIRRVLAELNGQKILIRGTSSVDTRLALKLAGSLGL